MILSTDRLTPLMDIDSKAIVSVSYKDSGTYIYQVYENEKVTRREGMKHLSNSITKR